MLLCALLHVRLLRANKIYTYIHTYIHLSCSLLYGVVCEILRLLSLPNSTDLNTLCTGGLIRNEFHHIHTLYFASRIIKIIKFKIDLSPSHKIKTHNKIAEKK